MPKIAKKMIGLTGGIGSGKSTVGNLLRQKGLEVIDLDLVGKEIYSIYPDLPARIEKALGQTFRDMKGQFDKNLLREAVFKSTDLKKKLEGVLHPLIKDEFERRAMLSQSPIVICEAALLIEAGYDQWLSGLIVVLAPEKERIERVLKREGMNRLLVQDIIRSQVSDEVRKAKATHVITNQGSLEDLKNQVDLLIGKI